VNIAPLYVGTSGYAYKEWKGTFYPEKMPDKEMLHFYAEQFGTVEINHSFYQMPRESVLGQWAAQVPAAFQFALKLNQKVTHVLKLKNCADVLKRFLEVAAVLQPTGQLGPILVQLPPYFRADLAALDEFLKLRPRAFRFAFEVRHASWLNDETYALLRQHETALCLAETEKDVPPDVLTADFVYLRLRREEYTAKHLAAWRERIAAWRQQGVTVFAYLKHEEAGKGPAYAKQLLK